MQVKTPSGDGIRSEIVRAASRTIHVASTPAYPSRITTPISASAVPHSRQAALKLVPLLIVHLHPGGLFRYSSPIASMSPNSGIGL
jgi:hypothetical protein